LQPEGLDMKRTHTLHRHALAAAAALALTSPGARAVTYSWNAGNFTVGVTAPSPLPAADVLDIGVGGLKFFSGVGFTNEGVVNWNADPLYLQSGASVVNNGVWNAASDSALIYNGGAAPSFVNHGTFRKSGGAGATTINGTTGFVNEGILDAQTGRIDFVGGSTFNAGSVFTGAGVVNAASGTNTFNGAFNSSNLLLSGGTHQGNAAVVGGSVAWSGGTLDGTWTIGAGQTLNGIAGPLKFLGGASTVLTNQGTLAWTTGDPLYVQSGATLRNQALFVAQTSTGLIYNGGSAPVIDNTATGVVRAAAGVTLDIQSNTGFVNNGGTLEALGGATIRYQGGSVFNAGSSFVGAGSNLTVGDNTFSGSFSSVNLVLGGGTHTGAGAVMHGAAAWAGGTLAGTWTVAAGQTLSAQGGALKHIGGGGTTLTNQGTVDWNTTDPLYLQSGASVSNQGLWLANADTAIVYNGGSAPAFENTAAGTVRAAAGRHLAIGAATGFVNNGGTLDAQAGASISYSGAAFHAGTQFTGAGSNRAAGNNTFSGAMSSANLVLASGVHTGDAAALGGNGVYAGGTLTGSWQVPAGQTLTGTGGTFKFIDGGGTTVTNHGTLNWNTSDLLYLQTGAQLANAGTMAFNADAGVVYNGGAVPSFVNTGLIVKSGSAGTTTIGDLLGFDNQGVIDVQTGTLALPANFVNQGTLKGSGTYSLGGTLTNAGTLAPGASPGTLALSGHYAQTAGGSFVVELESLASHDLFGIAGNANLDGTLNIGCYGACSLAVGDVVTILDATGDLSGSFASVMLSGFQTGAFDVVYDYAADRVQLLVTEAVTAAVPEPGSWAMWLAGAAFMLGVARRRG
jgi:hypothetical protein